MDMYDRYRNSIGRSKLAAICLAANGGPEHTRLGIGASSRKAKS